MQEVSRSDRTRLMPFLHHGHKRSAFPFPAREAQDAGMPFDAAQHADLRLRGGVDVEVTWPPAPPEAPALLVVVTGASEVWQELSRRIPAVLLTVRGATFEGAREALEWGADHAHELGADPSRLLLGADRAGTGLAAAVARHARDRGWPAITRHVLIDPEIRPALVDEVVGLLRQGRKQ
jgi:alpha/beta hydrolase fold